MASPDRAFQQRLLETFRAEAREHIVGIANGLTALRDADAARGRQVTEQVFREAHSLKAAARAVNRQDVERICQRLESVLADLKRTGAVPDTALLEAIERVNDAMTDLLEDTTLVGGPGAPLQQVDAIVQGLEQLPAAGGAASRATPALNSLTTNPDAAAQRFAPDSDSSAAAVAPARAPAPVGDSLRVPVRRLDALMLRAEELLIAKLAAQEQVSALAAPLAAMVEWKTELARLRAGAGQRSVNDDVVRLWQFVEWSEHRMLALESGIRSMTKHAQAGARASASSIDQVQQGLQHILMLEAHSFLDGFHKIVRDLARDQGKQVDFNASGGQLEVDRRILEEMREPLLHLVRNAVDHGVEKAEHRQRSGKPARATIRLALAPVDGDKVEFLVSDDGAGVALASLAAAAVKAGILTAAAAERAVSDELLPLIFHSGLSTSVMITEISGRGLGLAIVRERVERLGGSITADSQPGRGTRFRIVVPTTMARFRGLRVSAGAQTFVIPTLGVERVVRLLDNALHTMENRPMVAVGGSRIPLVPLAQVLELDKPSGAATDAARVAVVLGSGAQRVAFEVDAVLGDQEVLAKPLGRCLERVRNVRGATVLADGRIAPILHVPDLLKSARLVDAAFRPADTLLAAKPRERPVRVLLAEDSITARGLLKNILEMAGYEVKATVDGAEAWAALKLEPFDVVVSDVEMPRMNGFDLTARIRADAALSELPVMLITALESREDRERGVDVGASAYMLKGDFDQERLLEVLRRLA